MLDLGAYVAGKLTDNPVSDLGLAQQPVIEFVFIVSSLPDQADAPVRLFRHFNEIRPTVVDHGGVQIDQGAVRVNAGTGKLAG
jgi:hypothetical protein